MTVLLRRMRAALVNAVFWSFGWFSIGLSFHLLLRIFSGSPIYPFAAIYEATVMAFAGFWVGGAFSVYLARAFRHSDVERISTVRFTVGGALVATLVLLATLWLLNLERMADDVITQPLELYGTILRAMLFTGCLGGFTAWGTLKLARTGSDMERLDSDSDLPAVALPRHADDA